MHDYFTWNNPSVLKWLWLAPILAAAVWYAASRRIDALRAFLQEKFNRGHWRWHRRRRILKGMMLVAVYCLAIMAIARPRVGTELQKIKRHGADVVLVIDTSASMLAQDVKPSRLQAAKEAALSLIRRLRGDRIGVVVFAGSAYMYSPLTVDHDAAGMFVSSIEHGSAPAPGTTLGGAFESAVRLLQKAEHEYKAIVLISDGEDHLGFEPDRIDDIRAEGIAVHVIGVGTAEATPIPVQTEQDDQQKQETEDPLSLFESFFGSERPEKVKSRFKKDSEGETVLTQMNEKVLESIARRGGGVFVKSSESGANVDRAYHAIASMESGVVGTYEFAQYAERFQWPLGLAALLLAVESLISSAPPRKKETTNRD